MGSYKGRNEIAIRIAFLVDMAHKRKQLPSIPELALFFNVCRRTVRRDVDACREAGVRMNIKKLDRYGAEAL